MRVFRPRDQEEMIGTEVEHAGESNGRASAAPLWVSLWPPPSGYHHSAARHRSRRCDTARDINLLSMSRRGRPASRHPFFWATLALAGATVGACALTATLAVREGATRLDPGWTYEWHSGGWIVARVKADGPAFGKLRPEDRIVGINGDHRVERTGPYPKLHGVRAGAWYTVEIGSTGQERSVDLTMRAESDGGAQLWMLSQVFVALACCAFALIIGVLIPLIQTPHREPWADVAPRWRSWET